jgi:hypothetical protein
MQFFSNSGVQSKKNEYHIVDKVEIVCVNKYIFDFIDNVVFVVFALYSILYGLIKGLVQGRPTQVGFWAADKLFSHNLGRNLSKI